MEPIVEQAIMRHHELAREKLTEAVAVNDRSLPIHYEEESPFANLLAQAVQRHGCGFCHRELGAPLGRRRARSAPVCRMACARHRLIPAS